MFDIKQIENTITTLRTQAQTLTTAADTLEATIAPFKVMEQNAEQINKVMSAWMGLFTPKT